MGQQAPPWAASGGPWGRAPLSCTLCAMEGGALLASSITYPLRGAAQRHAPRESTSHLTIACLPGRKIEIEGWKTEPEGWKTEPKGWKTEPEGWKTEPEGWKTEGRLPDRKLMRLLRDRKSVV